VRWRTIENMRLKQKVLELEDAGDRAAIALLQGRGPITKVRPIELRQAVWYLRAAYIHERGSENVPAVQQRQAPQPPNLSKAQQRVAVRAAELAEGEARVQSLSVPEAVDLLIAAEDAERSRAQRQADARAADLAARGNYRRGIMPSPRYPGHEVRIQVGPNGPGPVTVRPRVTPERIARGEQRPASSDEAAA
jgi:hypothetical protein